MVCVGRMVAASRLVAASRSISGIDKIVCLGKQVRLSSSMWTTPVSLLRRAQQQVYLLAQKQSTEPENDVKRLHFPACTEELGDPIPENPVIFNKFGSIAQRAQQGQLLDVSDLLPRNRGAVHYEAEICLQLGVAGSLEAVTLGLDLTLREIQSQLKKAGHPWEIGKCFPGSAIVGPWIDIEDFPGYLDEEFIFTLEGDVRQRGRGKDMKLAPEEAIGYIEQFFPLSEGDIVFTGTPAGVGELKPGEIGELCWGDKVNYRVKF